MVLRIRHIVILLGSILALAACYGGGQTSGYGSAPTGEGPQIVWDLDTRPIPDIPFPIDVATRPDLDSPTGRRLNVSLKAETAFERRLRGHIDELDGWGTLAPIWVRFDDRLDLVNIAERHTGDGDFEDDALLVIDITEGSKTYGQAVPVEMGNGNYPVTLWEPNGYFTHDPRKDSSNMVFDTYDEDARGDGDGHCDVWEDVNQNGILDDGEDLDGDGRLDVHEDTDSDGNCDIPNLWGTVLGDETRMHPYKDLIAFYELETDTLTFRPLVPLREKTTYAVVLTKDLVGVNGQPIRSPFNQPHHMQQKESLEEVFEGDILEAFGRSADDIAFAWTFTTQSVFTDLKDLRQGLRGKGPYKSLAKDFPAEVINMAPINDTEGLEGLLLRPSRIVEVLNIVFDEIGLGGYDASSIGSLLDTYGAVDYVVAGDYKSPDLLSAGDGVFTLDREAGETNAGTNEIRFLLIVPKAEYGTAPFPTVLYAHGFTSMKLEALAFAGVLAKFGIATFCIDAHGHGIPFPDFDDLVEAFLGGLENAEDLRTFFEAIGTDRAVDLNGDGVNDSGGDFWTNDIFHTRDVIRQTAVDYLQAKRMLQNFDGRRWKMDLNNDGEPELAGDFNADGVIDVGGPDTPYYAMGTSMGAINSSVVAAVDPEIKVAAPVSGGGGLLEVGLRTDLGTVQRAVVLPILGPMVISDRFPSNPEIVRLSFLVNDLVDDQIHQFARVGRFEGGEAVDTMKPGDRLVLTNLRSHESDTVVIPNDLRIRAHIAADLDDPLKIELFRPDGTLYQTIDSFEVEILGFQARDYEIGSPLKAIQEGLGHRRNTPGLRRLIGVSQVILEPADPANWATLYQEPPEYPGEEAHPTNALLTLTLGDMTVPISAGLTQARAARILGFLEDDPRYGMTQNELLISYGVTEAMDELRLFEGDACRPHGGQVNFDIDDLSRGHHGASLPRLSDVTDENSCEPLPPLRATLETESGISAIRFPALKAGGQHAIEVPDPTKEFDASMFTLNQIGLYLKSGGTYISDAPCLARNDCRECVVTKEDELPEDGADWWKFHTDCPDMPAPTVVER